MLTLFTVVTLAGALSLYKVDAANPTNGTLAPTATSPVTWVGTGLGPTTNDETTCMEGVNCDSFALTLSGIPTDWAGKDSDEESSNQPQAVENLGNAAFRVGNRITGALYVLKNNTIIRISIGGTDDEATKTEKLKKLAEKALSRI